MSKKVFADGSVLLTGQEMIDSLEALYNHRGSFDRDCSFCRYDTYENEHCDGCSISNTDRSCSCHINPPCSKCVDSAFEVSPYLINYQACKKGGKRQWQCFRGDKETFDKLTEIEKTKFKLTAEILSTGEVTMYIDDDIEASKYDMIEICNKKDFKQTMLKMIMDFKLCRINNYG